MEPWISVAAEAGAFVSSSSRTRAASRPGWRRPRRPDAAPCFERGEGGEAARHDPTPYIHYFIAETGGLLEPHELQTWRLVHGRAAAPYTRERSTTPITDGQVEHGGA